MESGASLIDYSDPLVKDGLEYNAGLFYDAPLTPHISLNSRLGYTIYSPDSKETIGEAKQEEGVYAQLSAQHQLNQFISHTLSAGRKSDIGLHLALAGEYLQYYFVYWDADLEFIHHVSIRPRILYENGSRTGTINEHFDRFGLDLFVSRPVTRKLTASVGYRHLVRQSDVRNLSYTANSVFVTLAYRF